MTPYTQNSTNDYKHFQVDENNAKTVITTLIQIIGEYYLPDNETMNAKCAKKHIAFDDYKEKNITGAMYNCLEILKEKDHSYLINKKSIDSTLGEGKTEHILKEILPHRMEVRKKANYFFFF
jgi:hypothetical protein